MLIAVAWAGVITIILWLHALCLLEADGLPGHTGQRMSAYFRIKKTVVLALTLVAVGLVLSGFIAFQVKLANEQHVMARLKDDAQKEVAKIELQLATYRQALTGARHIALAYNGHPSAPIFAQYVSFINLQQEYPGMRGLGVIDRVKETDENSFIERMHEDGLDTFKLRFLTPHTGDRFVIRLIEPFEHNRQARGLDVASEALRREVATRAYELNSAQMSGPITLVQAQENPTQGVVLMLPVFANWEIPLRDADKIRSHIGWIFAPLVIQQILRGARVDDDLFHYVITDVTAAENETDKNPQHVYICDDYTEKNPKISFSIRTDIFGRTWQFRFSPTEKYMRQLDLRAPRIIFLDGVLLSVLLGFLIGVVHISLGQRRHTQAQNARLATLIEGTQDAIIEVDLTGAIVQWSQGATKMLGFASSEVLGRNLTELIVPDHLQLIADKEIYATLTQRHNLNSLSQRSTADGHLLDVMLHIAPLMDEKNKVVGAAMIIRDVTQLRVAQRELQELNSLLENRVALRTVEVEQARDELETLVNALPDAILVMNADHIVIKANQKSAERFASSGPVLAGMPLAEVLPPDYYAQLFPSLVYLPQGQIDAGVYSVPGQYTEEHFQWVIIPALSQGVYSGFYFVEQNVSVLKNNKIKLAATLAEQAALLNSINAQFLLSITDKKGFIQSVNELFCQFSGYSQDELLGVSHSIVNSGVHSREFWAQVWTHITLGKPWRGEVCNRNKQGELFWLDTVIAPILNADGEVERFIALRSDITARRSAETARAQISQLLTSVLNAASEVSIIATDTKGLITVFNRGAERLLGYCADEIIAKHTSMLFHLPEEITARGHELSARWSEVIAGFDVFTYMPKLAGAETRRWTYVRKNATHVPVMLTATAIRAPGGGIEGYLGIAVDISEQLAAHAQLSAISEQLLQAAAVANLGIWTWSVMDNTLQWNDQMFNLYQQDAKLGVTGELSYQHWRERVHPEDLPGVEYALQRALDGKAEFKTLARLCLPDGSVRYTKAIGKVVRNQLGAPIAITGINIDSTEHYLHEETLRAARDVAQEASLAKSQFLANMSHEIRTPMNAVLGMLQLLQTTALNERQQEYSSNAIGAAQSLLGLLNDVLDFSKIEAGKLHLDSHEFSLEQLLHDVAIVLTGIQSAQHCVELLFDVGREIPPFIVADKLRLQQILLNLMSNALKFTQQGFVKLSIKALAQDSNSVTLEVRVEDTGIGIAPEHQIKIFDGFTQAETSTTRRFGGTGLGLVICQRLLNLMGSELKLTSSPGVGSEFYFAINLPLGASEKAYQPTQHNEHVLLIEDNAHARALIILQLSPWCGLISAAASGDEGVLLIQAQASNPFDLLIIDWNMQHKSGLATVLEIKQILGDNMPPTVFMVTAEDKENLYKTCAEYNIHPVDVMLKPIIPWHWRDLFQTLKNSPPRKNQNQIPASPAARKVLRGLTLLVVEDNELNRQVAEGLLTHQGAQVDLACSGVVAVAKLIQQKRHYDLVFMDMQMPDMDGLQATRLLRQEPTFAQLPIVAMTANVSTADVQACLAAGMNDHVGKPLDIERILAVIQQLVPIAKQARGAPEPLPQALKASGGITEDWQTILQRLGKNVKLIRRAYSQFAPELEHQINLLRTAVEQSDNEAQARCFHSVKGVAATLGACALAQWSFEQEKAVKAGASTNAVHLEHLVQLAQQAVEQVGQLIELNVGPQV